MVYGDSFKEGIDWKIKFPDEHPDMKFYRDYDEHRVNEKHCVHCNKEIQIAEEFEEVKTKNAIPAFRWNDDDEVYIGGICWDCADKLCDSGEISIAGGGATVPDAYFM